MMSQTTATRRWSIRAPRGVRNNATGALAFSTRHTKVPVADLPASASQAFADRFSSSRAKDEAGDTGDEVEAHPSQADRILCALSAAGVPIGILALSRLGRRGGLLLELAAGALGVRAVAMLIGGAPRRLQVLPRRLLYAETALDGLATAAGFLAWVWQPFVRPALLERGPKGARPSRRVRAWRHARGSGAVWVAPVAVAAWMAALVLHTARMAIYISPGRGLKRESWAPVSSL
jgi:hypothetical protein